MNFRIFILLFFLFLGVNAQEKKFNKPNYKRINKLTSKKKSDFYYPKLMKRYLESDRNMTIEEKRSLYYGFVFRKNYKPYAASKYKPIISKLLKKPKLSKIDLNELLRQTDLHLYQHPFDVEILRVRVYVYKQLRNKINALKSRNQIKIIKDILLSSGDGKTKKTAFHVINTNHEHELLKMLGYQQVGRRKSINKFEYLTIKPNKDGINGLYFNLIQSVKSLNNKIKPKSSKKRFF